jgi:hypothetical protein
MKLPVRWMVPALALISAPAWADWSITNKDSASYELTAKCGRDKETWWISGGVTKVSSVSEGRSCTVVMPKSRSSCTVKEGQACVIRAGKIFKGGRARI